MGERQEIGGYQLLEQIGYGGMSTVYKAQDGGGNRVALKLLHPALADSAGRERLAREVSMLLRVKGSRVAEVLDAETEGEDAFIVTELIDGLTLEQDVAENGVYAGDDLADLAEELTQAVRSIHSAGVLHRDLKPSNVMMSDDGPVLIDFGISQLGDDTRLTKVGSLAQTPGYCDSRVVRGAQPDKEADWWALAAVLLFAATGRPPFGTGTTDAVLKRVIDGHADVAGLDKPIAQAFLAALSPQGRIDTDTLTEVLRHPEKAAQLLPLRSENPTQILSDEKTRVYETAPEQDVNEEQTELLELVDHAEETDHADQTEVIAGTVTEVVDSQGLANQYDTEIIDDDEWEELPPSYHEPPQELQETMRYREPLFHTDDALHQHQQGGMSDAPISPYGVGELVESEEVPPWARPAPKSPWLILLAGLTLSVYGSGWLGVALSVYVLLLIVCVTWGFLSGELRERRRARGGVYSHDRLGAAVRLPWAFVRAVLLSAVSLLVGAAVFALVFFLLRTFLADVPLIPQSSGSKIPLPFPVIVGVSFFVLLLVSWLFLTNKRGREGARECAAVIAPTGMYKFIWTIIFIIAIGIGIIMTGDVSQIEWLPLPNISDALPWLFGA